MSLHLTRRIAQAALLLGAAAATADRAAGAAARRGSPCRRWAADGPGRHRARRRSGGTQDREHGRPGPPAASSGPRRPRPSERRSGHRRDRPHRTVPSRRVPPGQPAPSRTPAPSPPTSCPSNPPPGLTQHRPAHPGAGRRGFAGSGHPAPRTPPSRSTAAATRSSVAVRAIADEVLARRAVELAGGHQDAPLGQVGDGLPAVLVPGRPQVEAGLAVLDAEAGALQGASRSAVRRAA